MTEIPFESMVNFEADSEADSGANPGANSGADSATSFASEVTIDGSETQLYSESYFVVLTGGQPEEILSAAELEAKLAAVLVSYPVLELPRPVQKRVTIADRVRLLIDTTCELTFEDGEFMQWYAVRLEKNAPD
jgi:hypothetical protein